MRQDLKGIKIGFCLTGSFCTLEQAVEQIKVLRQQGAGILPVISANVRDMDSRFGTAAFWRKSIGEAADCRQIIDTIQGAEPIGPQKMCDIMIIAPCTGNTAAKLANGIVDTPVLMAAKSHLRNKRPLVIALSTNDALSANAKTLGALLNFRNLFFVPFRQDDPGRKPNSLIADMKLIPDTVKNALDYYQIQPILSCES